MTTSQPLTAAAGFAAQRVQGLAPSVGLGLAISRRLAEMMGGELTYRHYEGWGTFALTLPEAPEESIHPDADL